MRTPIHYGGRLNRQDGLRLRAWLDIRPPTQAEIARQAGVSRQYIHRVLKGEARPTPRVLQACAELGMPIEKLVRLETTPQKSGSPPKRASRGEQTSEQENRTAPQ